MNHERENNIYKNKVGSFNHNTSIKNRIDRVSKIERLRVLEQELFDIMLEAANKRREL